MRPVRLLGLDCADLDARAAAEWIAARPAGAAFGYVVTPNADHFARIDRRPELLPLYRGALLCLLDSRVIAGAARLLGLAAPRVCPGSDLAANLLARIGPDDTVTVIGMRADDLPLLRIGPLAHHSPPRGFENDPVALREAAEFVVAHPARYVFLAVGSPRQEMLAAEIVRMGRATGVGLCVGAALEFAIGRKRRAPGWMRHAGLEWLHRLASEPRRLGRRYLLDSPLALAMVWRER